MMERLEQIKYCMLHLNSDTPENVMQFNKFLTDWTKSETLIEDCLYFLSKETNEIILFHAARALSDFIRAQKCDLLENRQILNIGMFISDLIFQYITRNSIVNPSMEGGPPKNLNDEEFFRFFLICIADSCIFSDNNFLLKDSCSRFPIEISQKVCTYFFEDWTTYVGTKLSVADINIEYTLGILRGMPVSIDWLSLYSAFAQYIPFEDILVLSEFLPKLNEALNFPEAYDKLIDHIDNVCNAHFSGYTLIIFQFSLEFSKRLRELLDISMQKDDNDSMCSFGNTLTILWGNVIAFNDEDEEVFREDISPLFLEVLKEFTVAESVIMTVVQKTHDFELWPKLIESMAKLGELLNGKEEYQPYIINIIEFILFGGTIDDVDLTESEIKSSLRRFYNSISVPNGEGTPEETSNFNSINNYLMNPRQSIPSILTFLSIIGEEDENDLQRKFPPIEIPLMYLENIEVFNTSPKDVIYFCLTFLKKFLGNEICVTKICHLFCFHFHSLPYECSKGLYTVGLLSRKTYYESNIPRLLYENLEVVPFVEDVENDHDDGSNWEGTKYVSQSPLIYMLPCVINDQIEIILHKSSPECSEKLMVALNGIASYIFSTLVKAIQTSEKQFELFLSAISLAFDNMIVKEEDKNQAEIVKRFCSLLFQQIMQISQRLWLNQSRLIQNSLAGFVLSAFKRDFVGESIGAVAVWFNQVIVTFPVESHFEIPPHIFQSTKDLPNLCMMIHSSILPNQDAETGQVNFVVNHDLIDFVLICLNAFVSFFDKWDESFYVLFPPQFLLALPRVACEMSIECILKAFHRILDAGKPANEFIEQLLFIAVDEYKRNGSYNRINLDLLVKIAKFTDQNTLLLACGTLGIPEEQVSQLIQYIASC